MKYFLNIEIRTFYESLNIWPPFQLKSFIVSVNCILRNWNHSVAIEFKNEIDE